MSERLPQATAPEPMAKEGFTESPIWEVNNEKIGDLVDKYLGETYVLDGKEYKVWFARPAGSVKSEMYISEFDLMGENGEFIEGISSKDLAARIDRDNTTNTYRQQEQDDSGGHTLEDEGNADTNVRQDQPSKVELDKRKDYIFNQAEWHLNREFTIGDLSYRIDGIYYGGNDGIYATDAVDIINTETGAVINQLTIHELEAKIAAGQHIETINTTKEANEPSIELPTEQQRALTERINKELEDFDQNAAFERAEFEAFLYEHPELLKGDPDTDETSNESQTPYAATPLTVDMIDDSDPIKESLGQKRRDAIEEFDKLAISNPDYEELRDEFMKDLNAYIDSLSTVNDLTTSSPSQ